MMPLTFGIVISSITSGQIVSRFGHPKVIMLAALAMIGLPLFGTLFANTLGGEIGSRVAPQVATLPAAIQAAISGAGGSLEALGGEGPAASRGRIARAGCLLTQCDHPLVFGS